MSWIKAIELETRFAILIEKQKQNGVKVDLDKINQHLETLKKLKEKIEKECEELLGYYVVSQEPYKKIFKKDGDPFAYVIKWFEGSNIDPYEDIVGPFTRVEIHKLTLSQRDRLGKRLMELGWKPKWFTEKGNPQLTKGGETCPNLQSLGTIGEKLGFYYVLQHREGLLKGIKESIREDGRVPADMDTVGTNTYRVAHRIVANIPKANEDVFFGKECREIFITEKGNLMFGFDASGLEARVQGHYTYPFDQGDFANLILEGDIHTYTQKELNLKSRDEAKRLRYALTYGAQVGKVQEILGVSKKEAQKIFDDFWKVTPGLAKLREKVIKYYNRYKYIPTVDGSLVRPRGEHSALNTLFQSAGAKIMKMVGLRIHELIQQRNVWCKQIIFYHDEYEYEIKREDVSFSKEPFKDKPFYKYKDWYIYHPLIEIVNQAFEDVTNELEFRVPLLGDCKIGRSWADVH